MQSIRIDTVSDSVQKIQTDTTDNTKLLHDMLVNMENLGESIKYLKAEMATEWVQEEPMETGEEKEYQQMQDTLLQEVSSAFPVATAVNPSVTIPSSMESL